MDDLFPDEQTSAPQSPPPADSPLADRLRPRNLDEYVGQTHILAPGKLLRRAIEADRFTSIILYGPPGTGKTTLARLVAHHTRNTFLTLSGVENNSSHLRHALDRAHAERRAHPARRTLLFVDELHRYTKPQQDILLPALESGLLRLIGATTANPWFALNSPLLSRSQVFQLEPLHESDLLHLLHRALSEPNRGLGHLPVRPTEEALRHLARLSEGDARRCLSALELGVLSTQPDPHDGHIPFDLQAAQESIQRKAVLYDTDGDAHYDTISAYIKSIRGTDPDAALYWLAKMLHAGEDPRFIARRLVILASEDIGLADPLALLIATAAQSAVETIGLPEARLHLSHATIHLAAAPKSNRATEAIASADDDIQNNRTLPVPRHLRDSHHSAAAQALGHTGYQYPHDHPGAHVHQDHLGEPRRYYHPSDQGHEKKIRDRLAPLRDPELPETSP